MENLSKNMILKTCFQTNENLLKTYTNIKYNLIQLDNIFSNTLLEKWWSNKKYNV